MYRDPSGLSTVADPGDYGYTIQLALTPGVIDQGLAGTPATDMFNTGIKALSTGIWANYEFTGVTRGGPHHLPYKKQGVESVVGILPFWISVPVCEKTGPCSLQVQEKGIIAWKTANGTQVRQQPVNKNVAATNATFRVAKRNMPAHINGIVFESQLLSFDTPSAPTLLQRGKAGFDLKFDRTLMIKDGHKTVKTINLEIRINVSHDGKLQQASVR